MRDEQSHIHNISFYGEILKITTFYHFDTNPRFPPFLLFVRWKSGVTFVRRCFRGDTIQIFFFFEDNDTPSVTEDYLSYAMKFGWKRCVYVPKES